MVRGFIIDKKKNPLEPRVLKLRIPRKRENEKNQHKIGANQQNNCSKSGGLKREIMS